MRSISCPGSLSPQTQTSPPTRPPGVPSPDQGRVGASCLRGILHEISTLWEVSSLSSFLQEKKPRPKDGKYLWAAAGGAREDLAVSAWLLSLPCLFSGCSGPTAPVALRQHSEHV